ncbi:MAG: polyphosphate kinase 1 [Eggerthellaceae bacterium]|jgi:polyphosphate kinase
MDEKKESATGKGSRIPEPYMQNRELSWLTFNERVLDQGADPNVPLIERMQFVSIFWSNLQEFFMVRVGSLTDLQLLKKEVLDSKTLMTPSEQLDAIHKRCHELYPLQEAIYHDVRNQLAQHGIKELDIRDLNADQLDYLRDYLNMNVVPFLSPQIINSRHPFPHLENGGLYVVVRLDGEIGSKTSMTKAERKAAKAERKKMRELGAEGVTLGLIPMPRQAEQVIKLPGEGLQFVRLENAVEMIAPEIFSMYRVKHTNIICVTRNADLDATEGADEYEEDYREFMKKILKKRSRLAPVRLESRKKLSKTTEKFLLSKLNLKPHQTYVTSVPLNMAYAFDLAEMAGPELSRGLISKPFEPQWPASLNRLEPIIPQICKGEKLLNYPYEDIGAFVRLLQEAAVDPDVVSIKITLYRLASRSQLAEALIAAAENGKEVTALFELRARFDESNNIEWSQRFEQAGCKVIYGFHEQKTHSKICCITRRTENGLQHITQLGTGNYNEKTSRLYTDFSFITTDENIGRDAVEFFNNMNLETLSTDYDTIYVAPLQIKQRLLELFDEQIEQAKAGKPCGVFLKTNSVTDKDIIEKIVEASQANVHVDMLVRGICCIVPGIPGYTDNVRVVSIVGRLLEHSRIYIFGTPDNVQHMYMSSADLMTRNMDKRVEIMWPIKNPKLQPRVLDYVDKSMHDTVKLRELRPDLTYTPLGYFAKEGEEPLNSQEYFIKKAYDDEATAAKEDRRIAEKEDPYNRIPMAAKGVVPIVAPIEEQQDDEEDAGDADSEAH